MFTVARVAGSSSVTGVCGLNCIGITYHRQRRLVIAADNPSEEDDVGVKWVARARLGDSSVVAGSFVRVSLC